MYEMQGPRQAGPEIPHRLPVLPAAPEPTPWSSRVAPEGPQSPPAGPKLPPDHEAFRGSRTSLQAPWSFPQVSRSSLRVVPVFAGREVVQPLARAAQEGAATIFMIL